MTVRVVLEPILPPNHCKIIHKKRQAPREEDGFEPKPSGREAGPPPGRHLLAGFEG